VQGIDKTIPIGVISPLETHVNDSLGHERLMAMRSSLFGGLALLLACVGLYGVLSYAVARRTNEIGIRKALGAGGPRILWMVLGETLALVLIGIGVGLPVALAASRLIASMLFGLEPIDTITVLASVLTIAAVTGLAGYIPARRASKVDPMVALRFE
jgi:ABC-type antimicrobial peptide transport system permease subunit